MNIESLVITLENALSVLLKSLAGFNDAKNPEVDLKFELEKRVLDDEELTPTAREAEVLPLIKNIDIIPVVLKKVVG